VKPWKFPTATKGLSRIGSALTSYPRMQKFAQTLHSDDALRPRREGSPFGLGVVRWHAYSMRSSRTGRTMNLNALMASTVRQMRGSETGSTMMPNDNSSLDTRGSCPRDSM
jgi:hypothetical protein